MSDRVSRERGRKPLPPAAWQFDRRLFDELRSLWLESTFGERFDAREWMSTEALDATGLECDAEGAFWFDYVADTGDGELAAYSISWLLSGDLYRTGDGRITTSAGPDASLLPRGRILVVGGDTAYNVADVRALRERFFGPFVRAATERGAGDGTPAWLLGIPGNHDYYDALDGFNLAFRAGPEPGADAPRTLPRIPGFVQKQSASYFAVKLPFGWRILGIDCELGSVDPRQAHFLRGFLPCDKLILATPEPAVVLGPGARGESTLRAFTTLGLPKPGAKRPAEVPATACRLDLSGDTHRYERHFGPKGPDATTNYASVVAGGGSASLHPVHGQLDEETAKLPHYPEPGAGARAVTRALLNPMTAATRTFAPWIGAPLALAVLRVREVLGAAGLADVSSVATNLALVAWVLSVVFLLFGKKVIKDTRVLMLVGGVLGLAAGAVFPPESSRIGRALGTALALVHFALMIRTALLPSSRRERRGPRAFLSLLGPVSFCVGFFKMGGVAPAAELLFDALSTLAVVALLLGLPLVGPFVEAKRGGVGLRVWTGVLGLQHAVFQLGLPLAIVEWGNPISAAVSVSILLASSLVTTVLSFEPRFLRHGLFASWTLQMASVFGVLWLGHGRDDPPAAGWPLNDGLALGSLAAVAGIVVAGIGVGWFFATVVAFGAFSEAAGGVAGVDRFKHFLRIRVRDEDITVFAIGFDEPRARGEELAPVLVDRFTLSPERLGPAESHGAEKPENR